MSNVKDEIWAQIERSNAAWLEGRPQNTAALFDENVVMATPNATVAARGREAMVRSYVDYTEQVKTHAFEVTHRSVEVFDETAVVDYTFDVDYELALQRHTEHGREILVLHRTPQGWRVVYRTQTITG